MPADPRRTMPATVGRASGTLLALLLLTACAGTGSPASPTTTPPGQPPPSASSVAPGSTSAAPSDGRSPSSAATATPAPSASGSGVAAAPLDQPWATAILTDVNTGDAFRIADMAGSGKVVFVEPMAIWCTNCRAQQREATVALRDLDPARVVWVAIDVETAENADALARYSKLNKFPFTYAIADAPLARALADEFGETVLSPPVVNVIVIGTDARITHLQGHKTADELRALAADHGAQVTAAGLA